MPRLTASKKSCDQCLATTANNTRCKRRVCMGNMCWSHAQKFLQVRVKPSRIGGRGLFAAKRNKNASNTVFKKNEMIVDYVGKFRSSTDGKFNDYVLQIGNDKFIDAYRTNHGFARYVNDCRKTGKKCNAKLVVNSRNNTGYVRAIKNIKDGEEILASYGKEYWRGYNGGNERNATKQTDQSSSVEFDDVDVPFESPQIDVAPYPSLLAPLDNKSYSKLVEKIREEIQTIKSQAKQKKTKKGVVYHFTKKESERLEFLHQEMISAVKRHNATHPLQLAMNRNSN